MKTQLVDQIGTTVTTAVPTLLKRCQYLYESLGKRPQAVYYGYAPTKCYLLNILHN